MRDIKDIINRFVITRPFPIRFKENEFCFYIGQNRIDIDREIISKASDEGDIKIYLYYLVKDFYPKVKLIFPNTEINLREGIIDRVHILEDLFRVNCEGFKDIYILNSKIPLSELLKKIREDKKINNYFLLDYSNSFFIRRKKYMPIVKKDLTFFLEYFTKLNNNGCSISSEFLYFYPYKFKLNGNNNKIIKFLEEKNVRVEIIRE